MMKKLTFLLLLKALISKDIRENPDSHSFENEVISPEMQQTIKEIMGSSEGTKIYEYSARQAELGFEHYKKKEYAKALKEFEKVEKTLKKSNYKYSSKISQFKINCLHILHEDCKKNNQHEEAILIIKKLIKESPKPTDYYNVLGYHLFHLGRHEEAVKVFDIALSIKKEDLFLINKATNLRMLGLNQEAIAEYDKVPDAHNNILCLTGKADTLKYLGRIKEAEEVMLKVVEIEPTDVNYNKLGHFYVQLEEFQKAVSSYLEANKINPEDLTIQENLKETREKLKQFNDKKFLTVTHSPKRPPSYQNVAAIDVKSDEQPTEKKQPNAESESAKAISTFVALAASTFYISKQLRGERELITEYPDLTPPPPTTPEGTIEPEEGQKKEFVVPSPSPYLSEEEQIISELKLLRASEVDSKKNTEDLDIKGLKYVLKSYIEAELHTNQFETLQKLTKSSLNKLMSLAESDGSDLDKELLWKEEYDFSSEDQKNIKEFSDIFKEIGRQIIADEKGELEASWVAVYKIPFKPLEEIAGKPKYLIALKEVIGENLQNVREKNFFSKRMGEIFAVLKKDPKNLFENLVTSIECGQNDKMDFNKAIVIFNSLAAFLAKDSSSDRLNIATDSDPKYCIASLNKIIDGIMEAKKPLTQSTAKSLSNKEGVEYTGV